MKVYAKEVTKGNSEETGIYRNLKYLEGVFQLPSEESQTVPELFESGKY
jgi:hypothetical protein